MASLALQKYYLKKGHIVDDVIEIWFWKGRLFMAFDETRSLYLLNDVEYLISHLW